MGRNITVAVKESTTLLHRFMRKERNAKNILRSQSLPHIKEKRFNKQVDLATRLGYKVRTMEARLKSIPT